MYDTIILGNGIAGMSAAIYAKRANLNFKIIGEDEFSVGQIENAVLVENYPGIKGITGYNLGNSIREQIEEMGIVIEEKKVESIEKVEGNLDYFPDHFIIKYTDNTQDLTKTVIYALGAKHRELSEICEIEGDVFYHHCAICDGALYKNKNVAIIGGGNTSFTEALYLSHIASTVTIITDKVIADSITAQKIYNTKNIRLFNHAKINKIFCKNNHNYINYTILDGESITSEFDGIFAAIGTKPQSQYCPSEVEKSYSGYILGNEYGETNIDGFYVAGDIRYKMLRQAITAAADGANCANSVVEYLKHN